MLVESILQEFSGIVSTRFHELFEFFHKVMICWGCSNAQNFPDLIYERALFNYKPAYLAQVIPSIWLVHNRNGVDS